MPETRQYHRTSKDTAPDRSQKELTGRKSQIALQETALMDRYTEVKSCMGKTKT